MLNLNISKKRTLQQFIREDFLDNVSKNKLLGVYDLNDENLKLNEEKLFLKNLNKIFLSMI